jgi:glycosyltransferase involved in cell wall biosynthesis
VNSNIGLIGRIDVDGTLFDGQTVKTRTIHRMLTAHYGAQNVVSADTTLYRTRPLVVALAVLRCMLTCKHIVVSLSGNGRRRLFPVLHLGAALLRLDIFHNLIGGWLASDIAKDPRLVRHLNSFRVTWVESHILRAQLEELGVHNARYLPNFKQIQIVDRDWLTWETHDPVKLCIFSRIEARKGIGDAISAVSRLNADGPERVLLDLYGPISEDYAEELSRELTRTSGVRYCGVVAPEDSVRTIRDYDGLLFPTRYFEEGIPGTVIDALSAGLPIIAARWKYYDEILADDQTGLSYEFGKADQLPGAIHALFFEGRDLGRMKSRCREEATKYSADDAFARMVSFIDGPVKP